ncbi:alpha/beta hydrolase [Rhizobium sp. LjRoot98]|uniref:alpha/beta fold hydrolase n=1 Tax=Rhizobium sp. LjRoot98 TaxID=3342345 RepID=UPI003ECCAEA1
MNAKDPQPSLRQDYIVLPDGRRLAWSEWGPIGGRPIIFCTGAAMSGSLGFAEADLSSLGGRLIGIDRPGLGRSDENLDSSLNSWTRDVETLIEARELKDAVAVGFSQGAPYALQLGASEVVRGVAVVSGQDDFNFEPTFDKLDKEFITMFQSFRVDPESFTKNLSELATADWLWTMVMTNSSDADRAVFGAEPFANAYRRCLDEGFVRGSGGYTRDLQNTWSTWPFRVEDVHVPVDLWYGEMDTSPVHSPDFGQILSTRIPRCRLFCKEEFGSALLWTLGREIITELLKH